MGFSLSWLAMKDAHADEACGGLGLVQRGGSRANPDFELSGATLSTGWYLVVGDRTGYEYLAYSDMQALSKTRDVIVCEIEEHVMHSSAALWHDGACLWKIVHDAEHGIYHLETEGEPPAEFESVRAAYIAKQDAEGGEDADVDLIFEVPLHLARRLTGYKHDEVEVAGQQLSFEELEVREGVKRPKAPDDANLWKLWTVPREDRPPLWSWPFIWLFLWLFHRDQTRRRR